MSAFITKHIRRLGHTQYIAFPKRYLSHLGLFINDIVTVELHHDHISIYPYISHQTKETNQCKTQS